MEGFYFPVSDSLSGRALICFGSPIGKLKIALGCGDFESPAPTQVLTNQIWYLEDTCSTYMPFPGY